MSVSAFVYGTIAGAPVFNLVNSTVADYQGGLGAASASFSIQRSGLVAFTGNTSSADYYWVTPHGSTVGDGYYVQITVTGNSPTSGPGTTPLALSSDRTWTWAIAAGPGGTLAASVTVDIATDSGMTNIVDTATFTVDVQSTA